MGLGLAGFFLGGMDSWHWDCTSLLLGIVIFTADAVKTRERISQVDPTRWFLLIVLSLVALLGNMSVAIILTAVGQRPTAHFRLFLSLSVIAVILSWLLLHTAFGQHYARLYYEDRDRYGKSFSLVDFARDFNFRGRLIPPMRISSTSLLPSV